jgi:hypothetical protein
MATKAENLNRLVENQDPDLNLQVALSHTLTRRTLRTFKSSRKLTWLRFRLAAKGIAEGRDCV